MVEIQLIYIKIVYIQNFIQHSFYEGGIMLIIQRRKQYLERKYLV